MAGEESTPAAYSPRNNGGKGRRALNGFDILNVGSQGSLRGVIAAAYRAGHVQEAYFLKTPLCRFLENHTCDPEGHAIGKR